MQPKAVKCIMVGISDDHKAWRLLDARTSKVIISRSVVFDEEVFPKRSDPVHDAIVYPDLVLDHIAVYHFRSNNEVPTLQHDSVDRKDPLDVPDDVFDENILAVDEADDNGDEHWDVGGGLDVIDESGEVESEEEEQPVRRSARERAPSEKLIHQAQAMKVEVSEMVEDARANDEPATLAAAMSRPDAALWSEAMRVEVASLMQTSTFEFVPNDTPLRQRPVSAKWVFKIKRKSDGSIERYKARLVARGFTQRPGVDFRETFAPVARMTSIRALLSVACKDDMNLTHLDVDTAFLNGELEEEIYMRLPEGLRGDSGRVVRLRKGLYGLKQASRQWYKALDKVLVAIGFVQSRADPCIYVYERAGKRVMMAVYVDDFVIADNDIELREKVKRELAVHFKLKDLGDLHWCLGLRVTRDRARRELSLDQEGYILDMLELFRMSDCKPCDTPEQVNLHLPKHELDNNNNGNANKHPYREAIGKLMYCMVCTRPDIASAVRAVSKHLCSYGDVHWTAVKRIMRYLKGTSSMRLRYGGERVGDGLVGYADADWGNDKDERKSVTGYVFMHAGGPVSWCSRGQRTVALSSTEAEYMSLSEACREVTYLRLLLSELKHMQHGATTVYEDNQGAIALTKNPEHHARNKHIDMRHHYCRDMVQRGAVNVVYMPTHLMPADMLTKALASVAFQRCCGVIMNAPEG